MHSVTGAYGGVYLAPYNFLINQWCITLHFYRAFFLSFFPYSLSLPVRILLPKLKNTLTCKDGSVRACFWQQVAVLCCPTSVPILVHPLSYVPAYFKPTGKRWRSRRRLLTPAFHFKILENFFDVFNEQSRNLICELETAAANPSSPDGTVNVYTILTQCALDIICGWPKFSIFSVVNYDLIITTENKVKLRRQRIPQHLNDKLFFFARMWALVRAIVSVCVRSCARFVDGATGEEKRRNSRLSRIR